MLTRGELKTIVHDAWIEGRMTWAERDFDDSEASTAVDEADLGYTVDELIAFIGHLSPETRAIVMRAALRALPTDELVTFLRTLGET